MNNITPKTHSINADGKHSIPVFLWEPEETPTAVIQVFHGLGEHSARYDRFAQAAMKHGYAVCAHDHRGHGPAAEDIGFFAAENGWDLLVSDGHLVTEFLQQRIRGTSPSCCSATAWVLSWRKATPCASGTISMH